MVCNGDEKVPSTAGTLENGALTLRFDYYATRLEAKLRDGALEGAYGKEGRIYSFHAVPYRAEDIAAAGNAPAIANAPAARPPALPAAVDNSQAG